nr:unnamed protein product [Naegleria fowleri]
MMLTHGIDKSHQETFDLSLSNRIFFFYGTPDRFINTKGTYTTNSNCTCQPSSLSLSSDAATTQYCYFDTPNSVTILTTQPGFCNLSISNNVDDYFLYISDFYLTPNGKVIPPPNGNGFHDYGLNFTSGNVPVSYSLFYMLFERCNSKLLRSSLNPSISAALTKSGVSNSLYSATLSVADVQSLLDVATFDIYQRYKRLDFDVVMDTLIYPVSDGVLYYSPLNASKIVLSPSIIRFGELTTIELGTTLQPLFTPSNSLTITICGSNFTSMSGSVIMVTESLVRAQIICTDPNYRNGMTTLSYSQSGNVPDGVNLNIAIFEFDSTVNIAYTGSRSSCSLFGQNNLRISFPSSSYFSQSIAPLVRFSMVEQSDPSSTSFYDCTWFQSQVLECPCPALWELMVTPPQEFNFFLRPSNYAKSVQDQISIRSNKIIGNPKLLFGDYLRPEIVAPTAVYSFNITQPSVYNSSSGSTITVTNIDEVYINSGIVNYTFYLVNSVVDLKPENQISCTLTTINSKNGLNCDYRGFSNRPNSLSNVCGCSPYTTDTRSTSSGNSGNCESNCNLKIMFAISKSSMTSPATYLTKNALSVLPPLQIQSIIPDSVLLENMNSVNFTIMTSLDSFGIPPLSQTIYYKFVEVDGNSGAELSRLYQGTASFVNSNQLALSTVFVNNISSSGFYILKISMDGPFGTFSTDHGIRRLSVMDANLVTVTKFEEYTLVNSTAVSAGYADDTISPAAKPFRILGSNFPKSETIKIKLTLKSTPTNSKTRKIMEKLSRSNYKSHMRRAITSYQKRMIQYAQQKNNNNNNGTISFLADCTSFTSTEIRCMSPNILSSGVALPLTFGVTISFDGFFTSAVYVPKKNGQDYTVTVRESEIPVIVQAIPTKGPIDPTDDSKGPGFLTVTLKGITTDVTKCIVEYTKVIGTNVHVNYTVPVGTLLTNEEFKCVINTAALNDTISQYNMGVYPSQRITFPAKDSFKIFLQTSTNLKSEGFPFEFYEHPVIQMISPLEVDAKGENSMIISADPNNAPFNSEYRIYFKLGDFTSEHDCQFNSAFEINCTTPAHPDGPASVAISYNNYQYAYSTNSVNVKACAAGFSAPDYINTCEACPLGTYKPLEGFFSCIQCEIGSYNNQTAQPKCVNCGAFKTTVSVGSSSIFDCDCEKGYYRRNGSSPVSADCWPCPTGATCPGGSTLPIPLPGYWWDADNPESQNGKIVLLKCDEPNAAIRCPGQNLTLEGRCGTGYTGIKCVSCVPGLYFKSGDVCQQCNEDIQLRFLIVMAVILILALLFFKFAQLKVSHLSSISIAVSYFQIIAVFTVYNFEWPQSLQQAFDTLKFFNLNLNIFVPECVAIINYGLKWGLTLALPVFFGALLLIAFGLECLRSAILSKLPLVSKIRKHPKIVSWYDTTHRHLIVRVLKSMRRDIIRLFLVPRSKRELMNFGDMFIHTFIVIISFSYVFVVTKAAEIFDCRETTVNGVKKWFVSADPTLYCFEDTWWVYFTFALLTFIFFGLGTIVLFAYILWKKNDENKRFKFYARFRFLFIRFRNGRLFWEIIIILRKLSISAAIIFFSTWPILVILFTMFVIFMSFILQTHHVPYRRVFHNVMEYLVLLSTEFLLFSGLLFYVNNFPNEETASALGYLCIITVIVSSVAILVLVALDFLSQYLSDRRKKQMEELRKNQKEALQETTHGSSNHHTPMGAFLVESNLDIELKDENQQPSLQKQSSHSSAQASMMENGAATSSVITIPVQETPHHEEPQETRSRSREVPLKQIRIKNQCLHLWTLFTEYLKKIEGESLDADLEEYDEDRLWDMELLDRGLPLVIKKPQQYHHSNKEEDSTADLSSSAAIVVVGGVGGSKNTTTIADHGSSMINEIKLVSDDCEDEDAFSSRTHSHRQQPPPSKGVDPKTLSRLVLARSSSDVRSQMSHHSNNSCSTTNSQTNLLRHDTSSIGNNNNNSNMTE